MHNVLINSFEEAIERNFKWMRDELEDDIYLRREHGGIEGLVAEEIDKTEQALMRYCKNMKEICDENK